MGIPIPVRCGGVTPPGLKWSRREIHTRKLIRNIYKQREKLREMLCALVGIVQIAVANPLELTLEDSIIMATKNNHAIKIAQAEKEQSRWSFEQAKDNPKCCKTKSC